MIISADLFLFIIITAGLFTILKRVTFSLNMWELFRGRPFNLKGGGYGFLFRLEFFFGQHKS